MQTRPAAFAGSWYPAGARACEQQIEAFLEEGIASRKQGGEYVGGIVPHAGWYYSGSLACNVIHHLSRGEKPDVILVFGMHLHPQSPNLIMAQGAWDTPLGPLPVETRLADILTQRFQFQMETPARHVRDNTIELQLPFVKYFFPDARVLTMGVAPAKSAIEIGQSAVEAALELGLRVRVIGSTDLTHYGLSYGFTPKGTGPAALDWVRNENDRFVIEAMLAMDPQKVIENGLTRQNACCSGAAAAAVASAKALGAAEAATLAYATSHDKSPGDSFVGYVGMLFEV